MKEPQKKNRRRQPPPKDTNTAFLLKRDSFAGRKTNQTHQFFGACGGLIILAIVLHVYITRKTHQIFGVCAGLFVLAIVLHAYTIRKTHNYTFWRLQRNDRFSNSITCVYYSQNTKDVGANQRRNKGTRKTRDALVSQLNSLICPYYMQLCKFLLDTRSFTGQ